MKRNKDLVKLHQTVSAFSAYMIQRLTKKFHLGYTGWDDQHSVIDLMIKLFADASMIRRLSLDRKVRIQRKDYLKKLLVDIANRAMMLYFLLDKEK